MRERCTPLVWAAAALAAALGGCSDDDAQLPPESEVAERPALKEYNLGPDRVAAQGYSVVSYFQKGTAERGRTPFVVSHRGVHYKLTSPTQIELLKADPAKYEPAYGGWCAYSMARKRKDPVDPRSFKIVNGRLLLFGRTATSDARALWEQGNEQELLRAADEYWKYLSGE